MQTTVNYQSSLTTRTSSEKVLFASFLFCPSLLLLSSEYRYSNFLISTDGSTNVLYVARNASWYRKSDSINSCNKILDLKSFLVLNDKHTNHKITITDQSLFRTIISPLLAAVAWTIRASMVPPRISSPYRQPITCQLSTSINQSRARSAIVSQSCVTWFPANVWII